MMEESETDPEAGRAMRMADGISVIIPASNEAGYIGRCLDSLLDQTLDPGSLEVIVIANGCTDETARIARSRATHFAACGWCLRVLELERGGKIGALNLGDAWATGPVRVYLDADVVCAPGLMAALHSALATDRPCYATGRMIVARARSQVTRLYADFWQRLPFAAAGGTGAGLFAVNAAGRARWKQFPDVISDDTFVRLQFHPRERQEVAQTYIWPMVEGFRALVRVRRRQDAGVAEIARRYPAAMENENKARPGWRDLILLAARAPLGFGVYAMVWAATRIRDDDGCWSRGR